MKHFFFVLILILQFNISSAQVILIPSISYDEHGFLPGKKFPIYNTVEKFNFRGKTVSVKIFDDRLLLLSVSSLTTVLHLSVKTLTTTEEILKNEYQ